jgi:L-ascorbate metabolism protein UlaG (beta-lactamase superfamily)
MRGSKVLKIKWFGHSMWQIETADLVIIIDPFSDIGYHIPENLTADIVISTHEHHDHANLKLFTLPCRKITQVGSYQVKNTTIQMIEAPHGIYNGKNLGDTLLALITTNGISILHCGDLGEIPDDSFLYEITDVDILFIPVGGKFTLDSTGAKTMIDIFNPKLVFPMHYQTSCYKGDLDSIDSFAELYPQIEHIKSDTMKIDKSDLNNFRVVRMNYE